MSKKIELQRIGGEAEYIVYHSNGVVQEAFFITTAPVRGFERLVRGKNPLFVVEAVMRICGICHAAHGIAASEAIEDAVGVTPPANGRLLRETIGLLNRVQSHLSHLVLLVPDIVVKEKIVDTVIRVIKMINMVNDVLTKIGGAPTHPPYIVVGGVEKAPSQSVLREARDKIIKLLEDYRVFIDELYRSINDEVNILKDKKTVVKPLASHLFYGDKYNVRVDEVTTMHYHEYKGGGIPEEARNTTSLIALYKGSVVETGPRARLMTYRGFNDNSLWGLQRARLAEIEICLERIVELLEQIDPREPVRTIGIVYRRGKGVGVYEAPRGTLIHYVELDNEGRVASYKIVVPTMFNIPLIEESSKGLPVGLADIVPRLYDPCIPCSTHVVEVKR